MFTIERDESEALRSLQPVSEKSTPRVDISVSRRDPDCAGIKGAPMEARQLIGRASFPPDELRVIFDAFDGAWSELAAEVGSDASAVTPARLSLAAIVLSLAKAGPMECDRIKAAAVDAFRLKHRPGS